MPLQSEYEPHTHLRLLIDMQFNLEELRTLCFDLNISFDNLGGEGKEAKIRELILLCNRTNRFNDLQKYLKLSRSDVDWSIVEGLTKRDSGKNPLTHKDSHLDEEQNEEQDKRNMQWSQLRPWLLWGSRSVTLVALLIICISSSALLSQLVDRDKTNTAQSTLTPTGTRPIVANITPEPPQPTTPAPTFTLTSEVTETMPPEPSATTPPTPSTTFTFTPTLDPNIPPPNPQLYTTWVRPTDGMVMVYVPGGTFLMGSDPDIDVNAESDEQPQHEVTLSGFWIDRTEVTNAQFAFFAFEAGYTTTAETKGGGYSYVDGSWQYVVGANWRQPQGLGSNINHLTNHPVVLVSWNDANAYCEWMGGQLPTEAQWEYAARGEDGRLYPWGDETPTCNLAQLNGCDGDTMPVGSFPDGDSWVDAADMAGNVWEWVADWYSSSYYEVSPAENPTGPASGDYKVLRGGSWFNIPIFPFLLRVAYRTITTPDDRVAAFGFRCAVPPGS